MCRVLQVHTNAGWEEGLAGSLRQEPDLEVHRVTFTSESTFLGDVTRIQPDVILLTKDGPLHPYQLREWLISKPALPPARIIVLNTRNNVIDIYDSLETQQAVVTDRADLSHWIRGAPRA
jgi:hypothetical protein